MSSEILASQHEFPVTLLDLDRIRTPEGALYASSGEMYQSMVFGRDSLESADDLLRVEPEISEAVLLHLSQLQGVEENDNNAEEFGRIPHQHMQLYIGGQKIPETAEKQMHRLSEIWGGDENGFTYYGSLDATPLFARLVARHALIHGREILDKKFISRAGEELTIADSFNRSLKWVTDHLDSSELNLLEFRRLSNRHIIVQSWRDSGSAFIHEDGSQANIAGFIAPLEVQGYAYDALKLAAELAEQSQNSEDSERWDSHARELQANILKRFWMPDKAEFAMGIDRDENWQPRQIRTSASSQGVLMDSRVLIDLPDDDRRYYLEGIVTSLYGPEFLTEIGVRCRSLSSAELVDFADYHGSLVVWAKETYDFAKGLRRQGFDILASDMEHRILNMVNTSGQNYEFLYVNKDGKVDYSPKKYKEGTEVDEIIKGTTIPDTGQAWTISAVLAIKKRERPKYRAKPTNWTIELERTVLEASNPVGILSPDEIRRKKAENTNFAINVKAGVEADKRWNPDWWTDL